MLKAIMLILLLVPYKSALSDSFLLSELNKYYSEVPGGFILVNEAHQKLRLPFIFYLNSFGAYSTENTENSSIEATQDLFKLDAIKFNKKMMSKDLLDAKISFFSKLNFNQHWQKHEMPYHYLDSWLTLNHPPIKILSEEMSVYNKTFGASSPRPVVSQYFSPNFQSEIDHESGTELTFENNLRALFNSESIIEKTRLVRDAKKYIFGAVMVTVCDSSSEDFVQSLIQKAQSGIPVTILMEKFYMSHIFKKCANRLRSGGVNVVLVSDKWKKSSFLSFFHTKFWIRDGEEAIIGGQNIVKYENASTGFNQHNRDTDLWIQGAAVTDLLGNFLDIWNEHTYVPILKIQSYRNEVALSKLFQKQNHLRGQMYYDEKFKNNITKMKGVCRMMVQQPHHRNFSIAQVLRHYVDESQTSITLTSPELEYGIKNTKFNQSNQFIQSIKNAANNRNVSVDVVMNGIDGGNGETSEFIRESMDNNYQSGRMLKYHLWKDIYNYEPQKKARKNRKYLLDLEKSKGVRAWAYFNYIHAKEMYFDRIATSISSLNLDEPSMDRNYEAGALCMDESLSLQMENQLTLDLVNSVPVVSKNEEL